MPGAGPACQAVAHSGFPSEDWNPHEGSPHGILSASRGKDYGLLSVTNPTALDPMELANGPIRELRPVVTLALRRGAIEPKRLREMANALRNQGH